MMNNNRVEDGTIKKRLQDLLSEECPPHLR